MAEPERDTPKIDLQFRFAAALDRPRLITLINAAFVVESFLEGTRTDSGRLKAMMAKGCILMAENDAGRLVASVYMERRGKRGYLGMLAVDPSLQNRGLGRRLLLEAEDRFRRQGCEGIDITVLSLRPELLPIYKRFGFVETGTEQFRTSQPLRPGLACHCIVMSKPI